MDEPFNTHQHDGNINAVGYSPTGDQLAVGGTDKAVTIYQQTTHTVIRRLELRNAVWAVAYSPDGKYFAAGGYKKVTIFSTSDFRMVRQIEFDDTVFAICFAADSRHMAVRGGDSKVSIFDTSNFATVTVGKQEARVHALSYSPNGKSLLVGLSNETIAVLDAATYTMLRQTNVGHHVMSISHSLTGKYIAVGYGSKTMIYEADNLESLKVYKLKGWNRSAFHPDGTTLTITTGKTMKHFDTSDWNGDTPLFHAAATGDIEAIQKFDLTYKSPRGITTLMRFCQHGSAEAVKFLLHNGAEIDVKNNDGKSALMYASEKNYIEVVKLLLHNRAEIDVKNNDGTTALMYASEKNYIELIKLLIQNQADVSLRDNNKRIASDLATDEQVSNFLQLYEAAAEGHIEVVKALLSERQTDINLICENGNDALLMTASTHNQTEVAKFLLALMDDMSVMQNIPKYLKYIGPTFLQNNRNSIDLAKIIKMLKSTEERGNEILHELVDDPSMAQNLKFLVQQDHGIADVKDKAGRRAIDRARPACQEAMKEALRLLQEFDVIEGPLLHSSRTACVFKVDRFDKIKSTAGNNEKVDDKLPIPTALKCMNDIEQVVAEIRGRKNLQDSFYVIALKAVFYDESVPAEEVNELCRTCIVDDSTFEELLPQKKVNLIGQVSSIITKKDISRKNVNTYKFVLMFDYADRSLDDALRHDRISDPDRRHLAKQILQDIGNAILELHCNGQIHADLKPLNIMRERTKWKLIDLDVSCPIGEKYGTKNPSFGCCPPEVARKFFSGNSTDLQCFEANVAHDLWSFGTIIFYVLTGEPFWTMKEDNWEEHQKQKLMKFTKLDLTRRVGNQHGIKPEAKNLLKKLLDPDPEKRLQYFNKEDSDEGNQEENMIMQKVLEDSFFDDETRIEQMIDNVGKNVSDMKGVVKDIHEDIKTIQGMSNNQSEALKKMGEVLLRAINEVDKIQCPTTFIILNEKLPEPPSDDEKIKLLKEISDNTEGTEIKKWKNFLEQCKGWVTDLNSATESVIDRNPDSFFGVVKKKCEGLVQKKTMFFYYVDELTGEPVRGGKDYPKYPFKITKPSESLNKMLPWIQVGMRVMSVYNGTAGVCQMFGYPVPQVPKKIQEEMDTSVNILKLESSVQMFKVVHEKVEDGSEQKSSSLRDESLRELAQFIEVQGGNYFANLHRITDPNDGGVIWTLETDENSIKEKLKDRSIKYEKEACRQEELMLESLTKGAKKKEEEEELDLLRKSVLIELMEDEFLLEAWMS